MDGQPQITEERTVEIIPDEPLAPQIWELVRTWNQLMAQHPGARLRAIHLVFERPIE